jgi:hypothetical protein
MGSYTVKPGDSWDSIAGQLYGNERMFGELMRANGGGFALHPGMRITTPEKQTNPFVSNELAAASGMALSGQYQDWYNSTANTGVNRMPMSLTDASGNVVDYSQLNQLWAAQHARGLAPDLVDGRLPADWVTSTLGGSAGSTATAGNPITGGNAGSPGTTYKGANLSYADWAKYQHATGYIAPVGSNLTHIAPSQARGNGASYSGKPLTYADYAKYQQSLIVQPGQVLPSGPTPLPPSGGLPPANTTVWQGHGTTPTAPSIDAARARMESRKFLQYEQQAQVMQQPNGQPARHNTSSWTPTLMFGGSTTVDWSNAQQATATAYDTFLSNIGVNSIGAGQILTDAVDFWKALWNEVNVANGLKWNRPAKSGAAVIDSGATIDMTALIKKQQAAAAGGTIPVTRIPGEGISTYDAASGQFVTGDASGLSTITPGTSAVSISDLTAQLSAYGIGKGTLDWMSMRAGANMVPYGYRRYYSSYYDNYASSSTPTGENMYPTVGQEYMKMVP